MARDAARGSAAGSRAGPSRSRTPALMLIYATSRTTRRSGPLGVSAVTSSFFLRPTQRAADGRLLGNAAAARVGLGRRHQQVGRFLAVLMANLDLGAQADDAVARGVVFDRLGGGQQRAQLADAALEQRQRVHRVAQVQILGRIVATGAGVSQTCGDGRQLGLEPRKLLFQLSAALCGQTYRQSCHGARMLLPRRVPRQFDRRPDAARNVPNAAPCPIARSEHDRGSCAASRRSFGDLAAVDDVTLDVPAARSWASSVPAARARRRWCACSPARSSRRRASCACSGEDPRKFTPPHPRADRLHAAALRALRGVDGVRERLLRRRVVRPAVAETRPTRARGAASWSSSGRRAAGARGNCQAACSADWSWRARWSTTRCCCSSTSRRPVSIRCCARRSGPNFAVCAMPAARWS